MPNRLLILLLLCLSPCLPAQIRIGRLMPAGTYRYANYPGALESLLQHVQAHTQVKVDAVPVDLVDFADPRLLALPFVYANFADRDDWTLTPAESQNLKGYLQRGGLLFIDAGITASFLRGSKFHGQHHSFAEWDPHPDLQQAFHKLFPEARFEPLKRSDPLYQAFYVGLPDPSVLPETVRAYTEREKWPNGSYAAVALKLKGRPAVIAMPIIAMGWAVNPLGQWKTNIGMRILEDTEGLTGFIANASYSGERFEVKREDGAMDQVFCETEARPSWNREPSGKTRVFRYYNAPEINDYVHQFYTRLGTNLLIYALTR